MNKITPHGMTKAQGCQHARLGNFCKLFPDLPSWTNDFGNPAQCEVEEIMALLGSAGGIMHDADNSSKDSGIPAAYTFFAQFVDHDITMDTTTKLHGEPIDDEEINELPNLRSASLDLDCVYGFGHEASPFMYDQSQTGRMLTGNENNSGNDLPRNSEGRALIGDPRNDENIFVSQMQLMFLKLHNKRMVGRKFDDAQEDCRYHYQWLVLYDFLRRVCDKKLYSNILPLIEEKSSGFPCFKIVDKCGRICMPVEFSVAAYRFGHTMVRSSYPVNSEYPVVDLFDERFGTLGFSFVPEHLEVDWSYMLDVDSNQHYVNSKAIDHLLADELIRLPDPVVGRNASDNDRSLAFRNLLRGHVLGLPSGQAVAKELSSKKCYQGLISADYHVCFDYSKIKSWSCLPEDLQKKLKENTPLFLYLMLEANHKGGEQLGRVGSAILLEVFGTMLRCNSFLSKEGWCPDPRIWNPDRVADTDYKNSHLHDDVIDPCTGNGKVPKGFTLADIARYLNR